MRNMLPLAAVGFSTRALCQACSQAGIHPISVDAFADWDCQLAAEIAVQQTNWGAPFDPDATQSIVQVLQAHRNPKILLAGGTENWPNLIDRLHQNFEVLGPTPGQLAQLRKPSFWQEIASASGIEFPLTHTSHWPDPSRAALPTNVQWLSKPYAGAGGLQVHRWGPGSSPAQASGEPPAHGENYLQQWVAGRVLGAYCNLSESGPELLGITEAFTQDDWPGPSEFIYRGAWGPQPMTEHAQLSQPILKLAEALRVATGLRGWVQFDLVESSTGQLWLLEVNPRWAAGMELLLDSGRVNPVEKHLLAFGLTTASAQAEPPRAVPLQTGPLQTGPSQTGPKRESSSSQAEVATLDCLKQEPCTAKTILYAPQTLELTNRFVAQLQQLPGIADIPADHARGQIIEQGHPLLTVKARVDAATSGSDSLPGPERKARLLSELKRRSEQIVALMEQSIRFA